MDMGLLRRGVVVVGVATLAVATAAGCGSSGSSGSSGGSGSVVSVPDVDAGAFTADFSLMSGLRGLVGQGKGKVGVLLPDTTTSARYVTYEAPYLSRAFKTAGFSDFKVDN